MMFLFLKNTKHSLMFCNKNKKLIIIIYISQFKRTIFNFVSNDNLQIYIVPHIVPSITNV